MFATSDREEAWLSVPAAGGCATTSLWTAILPFMDAYSYPPAQRRGQPGFASATISGRRCRRASLPESGPSRSLDVRPGAGSFDIGNGLEIGPAETVPDSLGRMARRPTWGVITSDADLSCDLPANVSGLEERRPGRRRGEEPLSGPLLLIYGFDKEADPRTPRRRARRDASPSRRSATPSAPPSSSPRAASLTPQGYKTVDLSGVPSRGDRASD